MSKHIVATYNVNVSKMVKLTMFEKFEREELIGLEGSINTGLAYSLNYGGGKSNPVRIENAFPELSELLKCKMEN